MPVLSGQSRWRVDVARPEHQVCLSRWVNAIDTGWTADEIIQKIDEPGYFLGVAVHSPVPESDTTAVGGYVLAHTVADETTLLAIAVHTDYRRLGLGKQLVSALITHARAEGTATIFLEVRQSNRGAIDFYQSLQFADVGVRKNYYPVVVSAAGDKVTENPDGNNIIQREHAVLMRLAL